MIFQLKFLKVHSNILFLPQVYPVSVLLEGTRPGFAIWFQSQTPYSLDFLSRAAAELLRGREGRWVWGAFTPAWLLDLLPDRVVTGVLEVSADVSWPAARALPRDMGRV